MPVESYSKDFPSLNALDMNKIDTDPTGSNK